MSWILFMIIISFSIIIIIFFIIFLKTRVTGPPLIEKNLSPKKNEKILEYIAEHDGTISISKCSKDLNISIENLRKLLKELEEKGKLNR